MGVLIITIEWLIMAITPSLIAGTRHYPEGITSYLTLGYIIGANLDQDQINAWRIPTEVDDVRRVS